VTGAASYQHCPDCRVDYTLSVTHCADCGAALVPGEAPPPEVAEDLPPVSELVCIRVADLRWISTLSRGLQESGVTHRVEPATVADAPQGQRADVFGEAQLFGLYVRESDTPAARELDGTLAAALLPEEAPPVAEGQQDDCPACGTALGADVLECPDCGLQFG